MAAAVQTLVAGNAENWDEDFDFHRANSRISSPKRVLKPSNMTENWDDDFVDQTRSSPRSIKKQQPVLHASPSKGNPTENWDDDFEDNDQPASRPVRVSTAPSQAENWDEEFAANEPPVESWDDEFGHSSDEEQADKEDRTVTAWTRNPRPMHATPPPPVPPLPDNLRMHDPHFSPTESIFSLPTTIGRPESSAGFSVTSVAALRPNGAPSSARRFAGLPASTPTRERRRLRKKSRPPMDGTVMELEDRSSPTPPETCERTSTPEPSDACPSDFNPQTLQHVNPPTTTTNKTPLLSRIGSVKKWRPGRKRLSTDPKDVEDAGRERDTEVTPRPHNLLVKVQQTPSDGNGNKVPGVPRSTGREELKSGKSMERLGLGPSPRHIRKMRPNREPSPSPFSTRPNSMMASSSSGSGTGGKPRHVSSTATFNSGNRSASASRTSFSASMEDLTYRMVRSVSRDKHKGKERERNDGTESKRVFMGGIRRPSFGNNSTERPKPDKDKLITTPTPKEKGKGSRHGRSNTISSMDTSRPPWITERVASHSPPQLPTIPVLPLPLHLLPASPIDPPLPPPQTKPEPTSKSTALLPAAVLQPSKSLPRPSLDARPSTFNTSPTLPLSRKSLETTNLLVKPTVSPQQAASLGRSSQPPKRTDASPTDGKVPRRNSLSDLRIPARITQAQSGLRRDLTLVKEFAKNVEQLKELQETYCSLILGIHTILYTESRPMTPAVPSRPTSPTAFFNSRRRSRSNATTMPPSAQIRTITASMTQLRSKFAITWECAELLIELGGSTVPSRISKVQSKSSLASKVFPTSSSAPPEIMNSIGRKGRERAITLGGDEQKPTLPASEQRADTMPTTPRHSGDWGDTPGKNDLSSRQLLLLREMLSHPDAEDNPQSVLERLRVLDSQVNRDWGWGGPMGSTITLPPSDGSSHYHRTATPNDRSPTKKRRASRLGMSAVREMLRNIKRSMTEANQGQHPRSPHPPSSESSVGFADRPAPRRRAKTSTGPQGSDLGRESPAPHSRRDPRSPYNTVHSGMHKSPRRPSLASLFRFAHKNKSKPNSGNTTDHSSLRRRPDAPSSSGTGSRATMEDEDWDRVDDSTSDLDFHSPRSQRSVSGGTDNSSTLRAKRANQGQSERSPYMAFQESLPPEPFTPRRGGLPGPEASRSSILEGTWSRGTKLSNVEEIAEGSTPMKRPTKRPSRVFGPSPSASLKRHPSNAKKPQQQQQLTRTNSKRLSGVSPVQRGGQMGSVRSATPQWVEHADGMPDPKLAMTPENIKPLLDSAREVLLRCTECVAEARTLLNMLENLS